MCGIDVSTTPWQALYDQGIRAVVFDKDNCLTAPYESTIHPPFQVRSYLFSKVS